ncbi:MAG: Dihydrolipoamide acetyltransferase component of pyruvate dehydrogenase complex [Ktedonobacterales bacterium]|jgi:pyruvate dehydrogenase E2 component (dihydrolipoamide acetyltransferase)|nr:MAG: Dihydrolipoamide acetyltransferase component of pyruvate dehydrogenase complex [Ktedonobacterales bacterium]
MHTVVMPKLGDTMEEGKILTWLKKEGDTVQKGDALAEIETEKVNIEVEAFSAGILRKILAPAGTTIPVGDPIALTGTADEPLPATATAQASATAAQTTPAAGAGNPATLTEQSGQANVAPEQVLPAVAQPQPVAAQVMAGTNGYVASAPTQTNAHGARIFISPIARRIAAEHDLDISAIAGTGPGGRIQREDVEAALVRQQQVPAQPVAPVAAGQAVEAVPLSAMRKTIAKRLQQSMQTAPHFYVTMAIDTTKLGGFRETINEYAAMQPQPIKVSVNDLIVKAAATALEHMPAVNVSFDGERLLYKRQINIGVAVALDQGLIVPVIRDANKRGVLDIARETRRLADAARTGKLKPEEFQGGTFSVSNLGMFGVDEFTAIINPPESCILAVGAIVPTPVVHEGQVVVRDIMKVTLSVDHRALDGATAARFLQELQRLLEQPVGMLL